MLRIDKDSVKRSAVEAGLLALVGTCAALALFGSGADAWVARFVAEPGAKWAWVMRQWSSPVLALPVVGLGLLLFANKSWSERHKELHQLAAVMVLAVVLGAGVCNQLVIQSLADRPRPRESVLMENPGENLKGHSMPSGHAAMGFAYVAPYFLLRRRKPAAARGFLAFGLASGALVGFSRMVLGAHFLTDVWMAGVVALSSGRLIAELVEQAGVIARKWWLLAVGLGLAALVLGNKFTLNFSLPVANDFTRTSLPCPLEVAHEPGAEPRLDIDVTGYGAPVSQVYPISDSGVVTLRRWGLYHHVRCRAVLYAPEVSYD